VAGEPPTPLPYGGPDEHPVQDGSRCRSSSLLFDYARTRTPAPPPSPAGRVGHRRRDEAAGAAPRIGAGPSSRWRFEFSLILVSNSVKAFGKARDHSAGLSGGDMPTMTGSQLGWLP
jgi:hypothetical protein